MKCQKTIYEAGIRPFTIYGANIKSQEPDKHIKRLETNHEDQQHTYHSTLGTNKLFINTVIAKCSR